MLRVVLLAIFGFLLWRAVKPYLGSPQLPPKPTGPPPPARKTKPEERVDGRLAHEVLGVSERASLREVQEAYKRLVLEHHPDRVAAGSLEEQARAVERTKQINRAYELMSRGRG